MTTRFSGSSIDDLEWIEVQSPSIHARDEHEQPIWDRQQRVPGFDQLALQKLKVVLIGAGGLNSEIGEGLVRKGVGQLIILDHDEVEMSNLNRQRFFPEDIGQNKAICLAKNLVMEGAMGTKIVAFGCRFQEAVNRRLIIPSEEEKRNGFALICGVDNSQTRIAAAKFGLRYGTPVIFTAVSENANHGYVFVQEPGKACFACLFPDEVYDFSEPCPNTPAVKDILKVVAGIALYALDTLVMNRRRSWDVRMFFLDGHAPEWNGRVSKHKDCPLCSVEVNEASIGEI